MKIIFATFSGWSLSMLYGCSSAPTEHGWKASALLSSEDVGSSSEEEEMGVPHIDTGP